MNQRDGLSEEALDPQGDGKRLDLQLRMFQVFYLLVLDKDMD